MAKTEVPIPVKVESPAQSHTENPASKSAVSYENMISGLRIELGKQRELEAHFLFEKGAFSTKNGEFEAHFLFEKGIFSCAFKTF